jgi:hypothetical protein
MHIYGAAMKVRTPDILITSQALYQLSYDGIFIWWFRQDSNLQFSA